MQVSSKRQALRRGEDILLFESHFEVAFSAMQCANPAAKSQLDSLDQSFKTVLFLIIVFTQINT